MLTRNFEVFSTGDWLAVLTARIPNAGEHLVRSYAWYSNVNRGKRRKAEEEERPILCPRCAGTMRIIAFIEQPALIAKILAHLGLWRLAARSPPAGVPAAGFPAAGRVAA